MDGPFAVEVLEQTIAPAEQNCFNTQGQNAFLTCICSQSGWALVYALWTAGLGGYFCVYWYLAN